MKRPEEEFFRNSTKKTLRLLETYIDGVKVEQEIKQVYDLHDFL